MAPINCTVLDFSFASIFGNDVRRCTILVMGTIAAFAAAPSAVQAQPLGPGPAGTLPGTSMADLPIVNAPRQVPGIPGVSIFGDTNAERWFGKPFDDSYLKPQVVRPTTGNSAARRAIEGRSELNGISADIFSRDGPSAIGRSAVSRGQSRGLLPRNAPPRRLQGDHPAKGGRAIIRR